MPRFRILFVLVAGCSSTARAPSPTPPASPAPIEPAPLPIVTSPQKSVPVARCGKTEKSYVLGAPAVYPIKGVLGPIQVVPGQTLAVGATVAEVTDLTEIDVVAFAPPRLANLRVSLAFCPES